MGPCTLQRPADPSLYCLVLPAECQQYLKLAFQQIEGLRKGPLYLKQSCDHAQFSWEVAFLKLLVLKINHNFQGPLGTSPGVSGQLFAYLQHRKLIRSPKPSPSSHRLVFWKCPVPCCGSLGRPWGSQGQPSTYPSLCEEAQSRHRSLCCKNLQRALAAVSWEVCQDRCPGACRIHLGSGDWGLVPVPVGNFSKPLPYV